jgi:DNA-directed RNA polymerase subunit L
MAMILQNLVRQVSESITQYQQQRADEIRQRNYINQIIENMIDDIDPRLRSIRGYKKVLSPCVERILSYAEVACSHLPGPVEFSKETRRTNPTVRALFANHKKMTEVFSRCQEVQDFFKSYPAADHAYMVLGMRKTETRVFGMQQQGDIIRKDVPQKNVTFDDYRITHPSDNEASLRFNLRERTLHECVAQTMNQLISTQTLSDDLEEQEIKLKMKLHMLQRQEDGLEPLMHDDSALLQRINELKQRLNEVKTSHGHTTRDIGTLNSMLDKAVSLLKKPEELIDVTTISLCIDRLNRLVDSENASEEDKVNLAQITFSNNEKRVGLLAVFPRKELIIQSKNKPVYSI